MTTHFLQWLCAIVGAPRKQQGRFVGNRFTTDPAPSRSTDPLAAELKRRGFTAKDGALLRLKSYTAEEVKKQFPLLPAHLAGIRIPYFDLDGKPTGFYRFQYFDISPTGWGAAVGKKPRRYAQEKDSGAEVYFPPFCAWAELAKDPTIPLFITEGEFKSAYASKLEFPTIGLGGVSSFQSKKQGQALLPALERFDWKERAVVICFDSDAEANSQIKAAESRLAHELTERGAKPAIARISNIMPKDKEGKAQKTGLDDFLLARGLEAFQKEVLDKAEEYEAAKELFELNGEVIYINDPGLVLRHSDLRKMSVRDFRDHVYANRKLREKHVAANGGVTFKEKSAPTEWIKWPHRAEARSMTYAPGEDRITSAGELNMWSGWGCEPCEGDVTPFLRLFDDHLATGLEPSQRKWLLQWLAYPVHHPGAKLATAVVLWGGQGTGKSLLGETMREIYGNENFRVIGNSELDSKFNDWAECRQFIMGDEITGGEKKRSVADRLKSLITQPFNLINKKYQPSYQIRDCVNYYFVSNHCDAFFLEDDDRRYFIHEVCAEPLEDDFYTAYGKWLESAEGPTALFHYLLKVDLSGFNPHKAAPLTAAKEEMIDDGKYEYESWIHRLKKNPEAVLGSTTATVWTAAELLLRFDPGGTTRVTAKAFGKALKSAKLEQWGRRNMFTRAMPVQKLAARVWLISSDPDEIARLKKLNGEQIYKLYDKQRPEKVRSLTRT